MAAHVPAPYHFHLVPFLHEVWTALWFWYRKVWDVAGILLVVCGGILAAGWHKLPPQHGEGSLDELLGRPDTRARGEGGEGVPAGPPEVRALDEQ